MIDDIYSLIKGPIYEYTTEYRKSKLVEVLRMVAAHHYTNCIPYRRFCAKREFNPDKLRNIEDLPFLPTSIFKDNLLRSVPEDSLFREIRSSATTSGRPSRIGLDGDNNRRWSLSLQRLLLDRIGNRRYKTMVLDDESALGRSEIVSARSSMTRSLMFLASEVKTCISTERELLKLERDALEKFLVEAGSGENCILFGFTFILYAHVVKPLLNLGMKFNLPDMRIIHAGGWKKLEDERVTEAQLIDHCSQCFGTKYENVIDIYGFTEQGGMLYPSCEQGLKHTPAWGDVICRDPLTLKPLPAGKIGLMQFITPIQTSYPGHSILTEDVGLVTGYDSCPCGRKGTTFKIVGRSQAATEERGCGDIMAEMFA